MTTRNIVHNSWVASLAVSISFGVPGVAQAFESLGTFEFEAGDTTVGIGGYAKLSLIGNDASDGRLVSEEQSFGTDFYLHLRSRYRATVAAIKPSMRPPRRVVSP